MKLTINNKTITDIILKKVYVGKYTVNKDIFYNLCLYISFKYNGKKGYISLCVGKEDSNHITSFINKNYNLEQFNDVLLEVYDTDKYVDTEIESNIKVITKEIVNNKFQIKIIVNDEYLNLYLDDIIPISQDHFKEENSKINIHAV